MSRKTICIIFITAVVTCAVCYSALLLRRQLLNERNRVQDELIQTRFALEASKFQGKIDVLETELDNARVMLSSEKSHNEKFDAVERRITEFLKHSVPKEDSTSVAKPESAELTALKSATLSSRVEPDYHLTSIIERQRELENEFLREFAEGDYTFPEPLVVQNPYGVNPLSAYIMFRTDEKCRISLRIEGKAPIEQNFEDFFTEHRIPVLGLYGDRENVVTLVATTINGAQRINTLLIRTEKLPPQLFANNIEIIMDYPFKELIFVSNGNYGFDHNGEVRHMHLGHNLFSVCRPGLDENKRLLLAGGSSDEACSGSFLLETDIIGRITAAYYLPLKLHHDIFETSRSYLVAFTDSMTGYVEDFIVEIDKQSGNVLWDVDLKEILDTERNTVNPRDWCHLNSLWYNENDDALLLSSRYQGLFCLSKRDKRLRWIIPSRNLWGDEKWKEELRKHIYSPADIDTEPPAAQHAAMFCEDGDVLYFNNGYGRIDDDFNAIPAYKNYSTVVKYALDHEKKAYNQTFSFGKVFREKGYSVIQSYVTLDPGKNTMLYVSSAHASDEGGNPIEDTWSCPSMLRWGGIIAEVDFEGGIRFQMNWSNSRESIYRARKGGIYPASFTLDSLGLAKHAPIFFDRQYFNPERRSPVSSGQGFKVAFSIANNSADALTNLFKISYRYLETDGTSLDIPTGEIDFGVLPERAVLTVMHSAFDEFLEMTDDFIVEFDVVHRDLGKASDYGVEPLRVLIPVKKGGDK